jgi:hypothetical protein
MKRENFLNKLTNNKLKVIYITKKKLTGIMQLKYLSLIFVFTFTSICIVSARNKQFLESFFFFIFY